MLLGPSSSAWSFFNLHIARVMESVPEDTRLQPREEHNLNVIAWRPVPAEVITTLDYFMEDYVGHLEHHLRQVFGEGAG